MKEWIDKASPTYPCLIDEKHKVAELYDMVNVPNAVWINEEGKIVRTAEPAGWNDAWRTSDFSALEQSKNSYFDALRDWVKEGDASQYVLTPKEVRDELPEEPSKEHVLATANIRMGLYLKELDDTESAKVYFNKAIQLHPESWNFKRQSWILADSKEDQRTNFKEAIKELEDKPYYPLLSLNKTNIRNQ